MEAAVYTDDVCLQTCVPTPTLWVAVAQKFAQRHIHFLPFSYSKLIKLVTADGNNDTP